MRAAIIATAIAMTVPGGAAAQEGGERPPAAARVAIPAPAPAERAPLDADRPAAKPEDAQPDKPAQAPQPEPKAQSQGRLIPPEEMPPPAPLPSAGATATPEPAAQPPAPLGPPVPETLRESDFDNAACRLRLFQIGTRYRELPSIADPGQRDCGIARPIEVTEILPGITLEGGAPMRCDTARALADWTAVIVAPAASRLPGSPKVTSLALGTTYHCRGVVGNGTPQTLSEHAVGNAIDIAAFGFDDGKRLEIAPAGDRGDLTVAFQNAVQGAACLFFTTVLGPGSNAAHDNHLHLDIKARRGGFRLCQ